MSKYDQYGVEDFVEDDRFIKWCLEPSQEEDQFWDQWMEGSSLKQEIIKEARKWVTDLHYVQKNQNFSNISKEIWGNIEDSINKKQQNNPEQSKRQKTNFFNIANTYLVAASLAIVIFSMVAFGYFISKNETQKVNPNWVTAENNTIHTQKVVLSDSSIVLLEPYSSVKYEKTFQPDQRTIVLKGEAFFDVKRDVDRPFIVYANQTITKVLGTSFKISAFEGQKSVKVDVISGKVAVYGRVKNGDKSESKKIVIQTDEKTILPQPNKKLEVSPNQSVIFNEAEEIMIKTVSETPRILQDKKNDFQFEFTDEPVSKVFEELEKIYGITILFDSKKLINCTINTKLNDEPLMDKVAILCAALNLQYKEEDAIIHITGGGSCSK